MREAIHDVDRGIAFAALDLADVGAVKAGSSRELLLRDLLKSADPANGRRDTSSTSYVSQGGAIVVLVLVRTGPKTAT